MDIVVANRFGIFRQLVEVSLQHDARTTVVRTGSLNECAKSGNLCKYLVVGGFGTIFTLGDVISLRLDFDRILLAGLSGVVNVPRY
jgi:hypothetical protein